MKYFSKYYILLSTVFILCLFTQNAFSQEKTEEDKRAMFIFNIAYGVTWENAQNINSYTIGVFSSKTEFNSIEKLAASSVINGKPVEVIRYTSYTQIQANHIVYVSRNENAYLGMVYERLKDKNVLIISDRSKEPQFSVINFRKLDESVQQFDINTHLAKVQRLKISTQILKLGGSREDIQRIYAETNRKLLKETKELEKRKAEIAEKEKEMIEFEKRIEAQRDSIKSKESLIALKEKEMNVQTSVLDSMRSEVNDQREKLTENQAILEAQTEQVKESKAFVDKKNEELVTASKELEEKQSELAKIDEQLGVSELRGDFLENILFVGIGVVLIFLFLLIVIINSYRNKQKVNKQLSEQYVAINTQKDEIQSQAKQLELVNNELEKLSIVASETDNAVTIMDVHGNFEWVNAGFTRMYGYTLQLLRNEIDDNIIGASENPEVERVINEIIETKHTGSYQNLSKTRGGVEIWCQTTITPILDENNEVIKLISIDTDITAEKKSELEIRKHRDQIEQQNEQITSSINYAKNIQQAILPVSEDIDKFFDSFVIFKPRDVVSGDFYWYAFLPAMEGFSEKVFVAAVDCTGHGVPGAFMSMIGSRLLSEIVLERKVTSPKDILEILDEKVKFALRQETTDNNDGMDMSLVMIEKEEDAYHITYSGAKCDLYYYSQKNDHVTILSSERRSIGGTMHKRGNIEFTNKDFYIHKGDYVWLSTDGIIDQNNAERKRFGTPKLVETLEDGKELSLSDQKLLIENELADHQGDEEQRDDITIWGIQFTDKW